MSNTITPLDVARMTERYRERELVRVREVAILNADADADADAYPTEKELYWERRRRMEQLWWSDACAYVFDMLVAPIWKRMYERYWNAIVAERNN